MARSARRRAQRGAVCALGTDRTTGSSSTATGSSGAPATGAERLVSAVGGGADRPPHAEQRAGGRGGGVASPACTPHGHDRRASRLPRPRARDGARRRDSRRAVRQRFEGDQRRGGTAIDRELSARRRRHRRRPLQGRRPPRSFASRCAARGTGGGRDRRSGAAGPRGARAARCRSSMRRRCARRSSAGYEAAAPDGVVLLAPACSSFDWFRDYAERGNAFKAGGRRRLKRANGVSGEQSSVGSARVGANRWERRLPRSARSVSLSTGRLMTADRFTRSRRILTDPRGATGCFGRMAGSQ